jgi:hypothetical protein
MSDIVKKYQHYFAESTRLQELVNEQAAYIAELEEAVLALSEDYFDSDEASRASRANVKKATKVLGAKSPAAKAVAQTHAAIVKSPRAYGISDDELGRREGDEFDVLGRPFTGKPTLTPITPKAYDGYDVERAYSGKEKGINLGSIDKAAKAIEAIKGKAKGKKR